MIPRGLQLALQKGRQSRQIWRVKDVPAILKTKIGQLVHSHDPFSCARCGREEPRMVATVHDAGQVFECVGVKEALFASAQVLDLAQSITNCLFVCICVSTGKRYASCPACDTLLALGSSNVSASQGSSCALLPQSLSFMLWSVPSSHVVQLATLPI